MGRSAGETEPDDWAEPEDGDDPVDLEDEIEDPEEGLDADLQPRESRTPATRQPLARRLIEQARETRELSRHLADFDDYII